MNYITFLCLSEDKCKSLYGLYVSQFLDNILINVNSLQECVSIDIFIMVVSSEFCVYQRSKSNSAYVQLKIINYAVWLILFLKMKINNTYCTNKWHIRVLSLNYRPYFQSTRINEDFLNFLHNIMCEIQKLTILRRHFWRQSNMDLNHQLLLEFP